jgi:hypothetical protein
MARTYRYLEKPDNLRGALTGAALIAALGTAVGLASRDGLTLCVFGGALVLTLAVLAVQPILARGRRDSHYVRLGETHLEVRKWPLPPEQVPLEEILEVEAGPASWRHRRCLGRCLRVEHRAGVVDLGAEKDLEDWDGLLRALVATCGLDKVDCGSGGSVRYTRNGNGSVSRVALWGRTR